MKKEELKNKTNAELESELKKAKQINALLIGILIPLFAVTIYGLMTKEDSSSDLGLLVVAIACSGGIPVQLSTIKKIKTELDSRKNNS